MFAVIVLLVKDLLPELQLFQKQTEILKYIEFDEAKTFDVHQKNIARLILLKSLGMKQKANELKKEMNQNQKNKDYLRQRNEYYHINDTHFANITPSQKS